MTRAVVFAHSTVGSRCLAVLLAGGVDVPLVVTHAADPAESAFASVESFARERGIDVVIADDPNAADFLARVKRLEPDFVFSFYYRQLLGPGLLEIPRLGALNMHGSLLPRYRGRVPVNWAVIHGEQETGATLHYMTDRADAGDIVDQQAVPILPDDTAFEVMNKVAVAAEIVLWRTLPALLRGDAPRKPQDQSQASYFGRRRPEDGRIDWSLGAQAVHDLVRGVAPPYPGAFTIVDGRKLRILRTRLEPRRAACHDEATMYFEDGAWYIDCADARVLRVLDANCEGAHLEKLPALIGVHRRLKQESA